MKGVVVEGITCAGKTELISSLKSHLKKFGGFDVKELVHLDCDDQYIRYMRAYATEERVLLHRSHVSEHVLGGVLREHSPFSDLEVSTLNQAMSLRFICVLAEPPDFDSFLERMNQDARHTRERFNKDEYTQIVATFRTSFEQVPHVHYVSSSLKNLELIRDTIIAQLTQGLTSL